MKLSKFKALTFDCYGTLIDWESGIVNNLRPLTDRVHAAIGQTDDAVLHRDDILRAHARHESSQQRWTPSKRYSELLETVYKRLSEEWGVVVSSEECEAYGRSVVDWPAFEDSKEALLYLKQHFKLIVLSNVDNRSFVGSQNKLGVDFDAVYTAEDVGSYKPSDRNFEYMLEQLRNIGVGADDILHTAESLFHDHVPANRHRLASCWIYRRHGQEGFGATMDPGSTPDIQFTFDSMAELAAAHRAELTQG